MLRFPQKLKTGRIYQNKCYLSTSKLQIINDTDNIIRGPTKMTGSEAFIETLLSHKVDTIFGIVGSAFMDLLDLCPSAGIRFISCQHEQNSAHMADGYSRILNKHGVCIAQNGPGISNFITGLAAAYWAHSPVIAITPECGSTTKGLGGFQEMDQIPLFSEVTKYQSNIVNGNRIPEMVSNAFDISMYERGPAQINMARDLFYNISDSYSIPYPKDIEYPTGNSKSIGDAISHIYGATNPVILVGGGVRISGKECIGVISELSQTIGSPVITTYLHNDSYLCNNEYYVGPLGYQGSMAAMNCIHDSDLVIAIGTRINPFGTLPQYGFDYWPKNAKIIQIDINHRKLGLTKNADVYIHGDCLSTSKEMLNILKNNKDNIQCIQSISKRKENMLKYKTEWKNTLNQWTNDTKYGIKPDFIKPRQALNELAKVLPNDVMVSTDIGNICSVANSYLNFDYIDEPSFLAAMTYGNCQYSLGAIIGAKVANPSRFAVNYIGDGAFGMCFNELLTCVRENIPITCVVFNNQQWGAEKKNQVLWFGDRYIGVNLDNNTDISFANIAQSMGCQGIKCDHIDQVSAALLQAKDDQLNNNKTTVIEIMCTKELGDPFRRDAMKLPVRFLDKYKDTVQTNESPTGQPIDI